MTRGKGEVEVTFSAGEEIVFELQLKNEMNVKEGGGHKSQTGIVVESVGISQGEEERGVAKLSDKYNLTGNEETKVRIKAGVGYKVRVTCSSNQVGQYRVPIIVSFYQETISKKVGEVYRLSFMAIELLLKVSSSAQNLGGLKFE